MKNNLSLAEMVNAKASKVVNIGGSGSISIPGWGEMTRQQREKAYAARDLPVKFLSIGRDSCMGTTENGAVDLWRRVKLGEVSHFMAERITRERARGILFTHSARTGLKTWGSVDERMVELLEKQGISKAIPATTGLTADKVEVLRAFYAWLCRVFPMVEEAGEVLECWVVDVHAAKSGKRSGNNKNASKKCTGLCTWRSPDKEKPYRTSNLYVACQGRSLYECLHTMAHEYKHALQKTVEDRLNMGRAQEITADNFGWYAVALWLNDIYGKLRITEKKRRQAARRR